MYAASSGPRRPSTTTSRTRLARRASSACAAMSVPASASGSATRIRATSSATLPLPTTTTRSADRSTLCATASGWALYQATNEVADRHPGPSSPGMPSRRSVEAPTA